MNLENSSAILFIQTERNPNEWGLYILDSLGQRNTHISKETFFTPTDIGIKFRFMRCLIISNGIIEHLTPLLNTLATIAIAIFTFFTVLIYRAQLRALKINERAWIVPIVGTIKPTEDPKQFQVQVELMNNGKTPAWVTAAGSNGKGATEQQPLPTTPPYDEMKPFSKKGSLLSPTGFLPQGFSLTKERLDHVQAGQSQLFIFGYAKYRDVYGDPHIVRYCFEARKSQDANHPHPLEFYVGGPDEYMDAD